MPFQSVLEPWQKKDFEALDPGWEMVAGLRDAAPFSRAYLERPRGHSKTTDIGSMALEILYLSKQMISGIAAASDQDQARLIRNAIQGMVTMNPWLSERIDVQNYRVVNRHTGSVLEIISNDAGSSYGFTPHFVIVDELTHWKKPDLWESLFSSAAKRPHCMLVIIANAGLGMGISWQWDLRESCRQSDKWYFSSLDGPQASWITEESLEEQRSILTRLSYTRLWLNQWVRESGEGLEWSDIEAALTLSGPQPRGTGRYYLAGLDLGLRNDHAALAIVGIDVEEQRFFLADLKSWAPADFGGQIDLAEIRHACIEAHRQYHLSGFVYDAYQAVLMMEDVAREAADMCATLPGYRPMRLIEFKFNAEGMSWMAETLLSVFRNHRIDLYRHDALLDDLMRVQIEEKAIGYKLTARRDEKGHADRAIALGMVLPYAVEGAKLLKFGHQGNDGLGESLI